VKRKDHCNLTKLQN